MFKSIYAGKLKSVLVSMVILLTFFNPMLIAGATGSETISIGSATVNSGDTIVLPITIADVTDITGVDVTIVYDANVVIIQNVAANGSVVTGSAVYPNIDNTIGMAVIPLTNTNSITATSAVPIIDIIFEVVGSSGSSILELQEVEFGDALFNVYTPGTINNGVIIITDSNNAPLASDQSVTTLEDTPVDITLSATDVDGDSLTYTIVDEPAHGTVTLGGTINIATYTPDANYNGADSFTFKANDSAVDSNTATVSIDVVDVGDLLVMAESFGVSDASGLTGSTVSVSLEIVNVSNGPIQTMVFYMDYNESVISLESVDTGTLTSGVWIPMLGTDNHSITLSTPLMAMAIPNGSTGNVANLNFKVVGSMGDTSTMTLEDIDFSNTANEHGIAIAKVGIFEILKFGSISGSVSYSSDGTAIDEVIVELIQDESVVATTTTNSIGEYAFEDYLPGTYELKFSKTHFYDESSGAVEVCAGINTVVDMGLRLKGDLDNNGAQADAVDVNMMLQASVKDIPANRYFDIDGNGNYADAVDVNMMLQASVKDIIL